MHTIKLCRASVATMHNNWAGIDCHCSSSHRSPEQCVQRLVSAFQRRHISDDWIFLKTTVQMLLKYSFRSTKIAVKVGVRRHVVFYCYIIHRSHITSDVMQPVNSSSNACSTFVVSRADASRYVTPCSSTTNHSFASYHPLTGTQAKYGFNNGYNTSTVGTRQMHMHQQVLTSKRRNFLFHHCS